MRDVSEYDHYNSIIVVLCSDKDFYRGGVGVMILLVTVYVAASPLRLLTRVTEIFNLVT